MERGLMWLPLLGLFIWLAWAGWNEYQKVEAYKTWAADFERAKYDIYAALGQKADQLTWGSPSRKGPVDLKTVSLKEVESISVNVDGQEFPIQLDETSDLPEKGRKVAIAIHLPNETVSIPFTDAELAGKWAQQLEQLRQTYRP
ncbi:MAG: hypothetical protein ACTS2F_04810 [Thainema sp.]